MVRGGARHLLSPNVALRACESFQSLEVSAKERGAGGGTPPAPPPRHTCIVTGTEPNTLVGREICQFQPVWSKHTPDFLLEVMERLGDLCAGKDDLGSSHTSGKMKQNWLRTIRSSFFHKAYILHNSLTVFSAY